MATYCHILRKTHFKLYVSGEYADDNALTEQDANSIVEILAADPRTAHLKISIHRMYYDVCSNCGEYFSIRVYRYNEHLCSHCDAQVEFGGPDGTPTVEVVMFTGALDSPRGQ